MTEAGKVIDIREDGKAVVRFTRKDACAHCNLCSMRSGDAHIDMTMENKLSAQKDDTVIVEMKDGGMGVLTVILYAVPLFLMLVAILITILLKPEEEYVVGVVAVAVCLFAYIAIYIINRKIKPKRRLEPVMLKIIK